MSLVYAKISDVSACVLCVPRVFLHASVVYVACGIEILDVLDIKIRVATLVRESTYLRSSHGSRRRSASRYLPPRTRVRDTHYKNT
jgi:hypothetical protein